MKFYASFFNYGLKKVPVIVAEIEYEHSPDFEHAISTLYTDILQNCQFTMVRPSVGPNKEKQEEISIITIYHVNGQRPEFIFAVKKEFAEQIPDKLFFELHLYVTNGYLGDILEKHYLNTVLYKDKLCKEVAYNSRPVFNILNEEGKSLLRCKK